MINVSLELQQIVCIAPLLTDLDEVPLEREALYQNKKRERKLALNAIYCIIYFYFNKLLLNLSVLDCLLEVVCVTPFATLLLLII